MRRKTKRILITTAFSLLTLILGFLIAYYLFGIRGMGEMKEKYDRELEVYKQDYSQSCYVLARNVNEGDEVKKEDFIIQVIPSTLFHDEVVQDVEKIAGARYSKNYLKNSLAYKDMFYNLKDLQKDLRRYELAAISLGKDTKSLDYVDVRISFPSGLDYVVLSKKRIEQLSVDGEEELKELNPKKICTFLLTSEEILRLSSALVDAYLTEGALLYTTTYVSPYNQEAAQVTYPTNEAVQELMAQDPNVVKKAIVELESSKRKLLNSSLISYNENEQLQLLSGLKSEREEKDEPKEEKKESELEANQDKNKVSDKKKKGKKEEQIDINDSNSID